MALVVSLIGTFLLYSRVKRQFTKLPSVKVVVSTEPLDAGTQVAEKQIALVDWPSDLPLDGVFRQSSEVVGRILLYAVPKSEPLRESLLAGPGSAIGLSAKIPAGMRAVAVVTNEVNNLSGFLFPGSHVDVLVTFRGDAGGPDSALTTTVLQNVEVLSAGERLQPDPSGKPQNVKLVTLLLNPDDAQKLMLASNQGTVQFVLRNGADLAQVASRPVQLSELRGTPAPGATRPARAPAAPRPAGGYEVETFDGPKKGVVKF
jgi:pilus assembly protein CpaB